MILQGIHYTSWGCMVWFAIRLTCNENSPSKQPIPVNTSLKFPHSCCIISALPLIIILALTQKEVIYFEMVSVFTQYFSALSASCIMFEFAKFWFIYYYVVITLHILNCVTVILLYILNCMLSFLVGHNCSFLPQEIIFYICVKALCFQHCLYLLYMVLLLKLDLTMYLDLPLLQNVCY